jgi:hypothetical protein
MSQKPAIMALFEGVPVVWASEGITKKGGTDGDILHVWKLLG